jgi:hypothetical protein
MEDYRKLNDQWKMYSMRGGGNYAGQEYADFDTAFESRGGYGPSPLRGGATGISSALASLVAPDFLRGGYRKRSSKKSKSKSKRSKSKRSKSKRSKSKRSKSKRSKSKKSKSK